MAIDIKATTDVLFGLKEQTTFGTALASTTAFETILVENPAIILPDVTVLEEPQSRSNRYRDIDDYIVHEKGAMPAISVPTFRARKTDIPNFLYAFFQNVTEGELTPFDKTFTFNSSQPDFTNAAGFYLTCAQNNPSTTDDYVVADVIARGLTFTIEQGTPMTMTADMVGRGSIAATENLSGTWTTASGSFFYLEDLDRFTCDFGSSVSLIPSRIEIGFTQNVGKNGQDGGDFATYALSNYGGSINFTATYEGNAADLMGYFRNGTIGKINVGWGNATPGTDDGDLDFTLNCILDSAPTIDTGGDHLTITASATLVADADNSEVPATVVIADAVDKSW